MIQAVVIVIMGVAFIMNTVLHLLAVVVISAVTQEVDIEGSLIPVSWIASNILLMILAIIANSPWKHESAPTR